jgi:hypothetical protein
VTPDRATKMLKPELLKNLKLKRKSLKNLTITSNADFFFFGFEGDDYDKNKSNFFRFSIADAMTKIWLLHVVATVPSRKSLIIPSALHGLRHVARKSLGCSR